MLLSLLPYLLIGLASIAFVIIGVKVYTFIHIVRMANTVSNHPEELKAVTLAVGGLLGQKKVLAQAWDTLGAVMEVENLGVVEQRQDLQGSQLQSAVSVIENTLGRQILLQARIESKSGLANQFYTLPTPVCQRLANILERDEATFLRRVAQYEREQRLQRPQGTWGRVKSWLYNLQFPFQMLKDFGTLEEDARGSKITAYLGNKQGEPLLILSSVTQWSDSADICWHPFGAAGREALRRAVLKI